MALHPVLEEELGAAGASLSALALSRRGARRPAEAGKARAATGTRWAAGLACPLLLVWVGVVPASAMPIFTRVVESGRTLTLEVEPTEDVDSVRCKILDQIGWPTERQILTFNGVLLEDGHAIGEYGIVQDSQLDLTALPPCVHGRVRDAGTTLPVQGALVGTGSSPPVVTDTGGAYFLFVAAGNLDVTASAPGYDTQTVHGLDVPESPALTQDFALDPSTAAGPLPAVLLLLPAAQD